MEFSMEESFDIVVELISGSVIIGLIAFFITSFPLAEIMERMVVV